MIIFALCAKTATLQTVAEYPKIAYFKYRPGHKTKKIPIDFQSVGVFLLSACTRFAQESGVLLFFWRIQTFPGTSAFKVLREFGKVDFLFNYCLVSSILGNSIT